MPLMDHFHDPWRDEVPWPSLAMSWICSIGARFNHTPGLERYIAHVLARRIDDFDPAAASEGPDAGFSDDPGDDPAMGPHEFVTQIKDEEDHYRLLGVIEFVCPSNKDRAGTRSHFVSKCVNHLEHGVGVVVVDLVTGRSVSIHNEIVAVLDVPARPFLPDAVVSVSSYCPVTESDRKPFDVWTREATIGQPIPSVPLVLGDGTIVQIDLEATYIHALAGYNLVPTA